MYPCTFHYAWLFSRLTFFSRGLEQQLLFIFSTLVLCGNVKIHFCGGGVVDVLKSGGDKSGSLYLTTHRMIFISKKEHPLKSFSFPFVAIRNLELEQPIFGTKGNYIKGHILPQPGGGFQVISGQSIVIKCTAYKYIWFIVLQQYFYFVIL